MFICLLLDVSVVRKCRCLRRSCGIPGWIETSGKTTLHVDRSGLYSSYVLSAIHLVASCKTRSTQTNEKKSKPGCLRPHFSTITSLTIQILLPTPHLVRLAQSQEAEYSHKWPVSSCISARPSHFLKDACQIFRDAPEFCLSSQLSLRRPTWPTQSGPTTRDPWTPGTCGPDTRQRFPKRNSLREAKLTAFVKVTLQTRSRDYPKRPLRYSPPHRPTWPNCAEDGPIFP